MSYDLITTNVFEKDIRRLPANIQKRALDKIEEIRVSPLSFKELSGPLKGLFSARFGDFRIIYAVDERNQTVNLLKVRSRGRVYS